MSGTARIPRPIICECGEHIQPCGCGGTACPGWRHVREWGSHWCGHGDQGKARPRP